MATEPNTPASAPEPRPGKSPEGRNPGAKWFFVGLGGLFLFGLCLQLILSGMLHKLVSSPPPEDRWHPAHTRSPEASPFPHLQISPPADLAAFRAREDVELETYGWINRTAGAVRIPVSEALEVVLREGLPTRQNPEASGLGPSSYELILRRATNGAPVNPGER